MRSLLGDHFVPVLCGLIVVSRLGDIGSTRLATPRLVFEANPVVRRFGWLYAWLTLLVALVPLFDPWLGVLVLVPSLLAAASNFSRAMAMRALGEEEYLEHVLRVVRRTTPARAIGAQLASASFYALAGLSLLLFSASTNDLSYAFALGMIVFGGAIALHGTLAQLRMFRLARARAKASPSG